MEMTPRQREMALLRATFPHFVPFLIVAMRFLGFKTTDMQKDIGAFLEYGPKDIMVQAQRSQAKTTITAAFAVWCLIHNPKHRVLIVSAGGKQANEISTLIVRLILNMPILTPLRPNKTAGDRVSVEAFDVHHELKGVDKSPSVACMGITANAQGKRATLLIADDVESKKLSRTAAMREILSDLIKDFPSQVDEGRIIFLGTPQSESSIYNALPAQGYTVRIWPGRYPTPELLEHYGSMLAPSIANALKLNPELGTGGGLSGDLGLPTDPERLDEEALRSKEQKQGLAYFQLQHLLCTKLADEARYALKATNLVVMRLPKGDRLPVTVVRGMTADHIQKYNIGSMSVALSSPQYVSSDLETRAGRHMRIDPAGGGRNGDETGVAVTDQLRGNVFLRLATGLPGGMDDVHMEALADVIQSWMPDSISIERNMGNGAFTKVLMPHLERRNIRIPITDDWEGTQKEIRIIDTLEPIMGRGSLIVDEDVIQDDFPSTIKHPQEKRLIFTFMHQLTRITRDKGCLLKDDRLDAAAAAVAYWVKSLSQDSLQAEEEIRRKEFEKWAQDPLGHNRIKQIRMRPPTYTTIRRR